MKGTNRAVTVTGAIAAGFLAMSQAPMPPGYEWISVGCVLVASGLGGMCAYLAKGKDTTGGTIQQ